MYAGCMLDVCYPCDAMVYAATLRIHDMLMALGPLGAAPKQESRSARPPAQHTAHLLRPRPFVFFADLPIAWPSSTPSSSLFGDHTTYHILSHPHITLPSHTLATSNSPSRRLEPTSNVIPSSRATPPCACLRLPPPFSEISFLDCRRCTLRYTSSNIDERVSFPSPSSRSATVSNPAILVSSRSSGGEGTRLCQGSLAVGHCRSSASP